MLSESPQGPHRADSHASRLPSQPTPLVGRDGEVEMCRGRLLREDVRLLTLVGAAGTGKTRLAVEVARRVAGEFADGAQFVDLSTLSDPQLLVSTIAQALGLRDDRERTVEDAVRQHLVEREVLLLLDNFEQLLPAAPRVADLLQTCPRLKVLITSRSALRLSWEHEVPVPPLAVPDLARLPPLAVLGEIASVALFVQRAQRVDPEFRLTSSNAQTVAEICVRLDGLPLAIELAAARTRVLPARSLVARLERRLSVLEGGPLDQPARQRTLRAALDWSYELLTPAEQALFRRLGVFVGGWTLDPIGEVCDLDGDLGTEPLVGIESLLDRSLVQQDRSAPIGELSEPRFRMLETLREYALERLDEAGERDAVRRRHATYYLGGAEAVLGQIRSTQQAAWLQILEAEHDNLRAALAWCQEQREPALGLRAVGLLAWFWSVRGYVAEGRARLDGLLAIPGEDQTTLRAEALRSAGSLALYQLDYATARRLLEESLRIRRALRDHAGEVGALTGLGATALQEGDTSSAWAHFEEALAIQRDLGDKLGTAESLNSLANIAHGRGDLETARELYAQSAALNRELGYRPDVVLHNQAIVAQEQGDLAGARRLLEESVAIKRRLADGPGLAFSLAKLGEMAAAQGEVGEAGRLLAESLAIQRSLGDRAGLAFALERFAVLAATNGEPERALYLAGAAGGLRNAIDAPLDPAASAAFRTELTAARRVLGDTAAQAAWDRGLAGSVDEVVAEALSVGTAPAAKRHVSIEADDHLSPREHEVAALVARGLTNREIADSLTITERTAAAHVEHILAKLGFSSRTQIAVWAAGRGLTAR